MLSYQKIGKRIFDVIVSSLLLVILSPLLIFLSMLVRIKFGSPIFFKQIRPGYQGKPFTIYKFRSMKQTYDLNGNLLPDEERMCSFGNFLRNLSLDELPELINVIKGDMSLVGPRPLLMEYLSYYTPKQARRNEIKPGITGWAQVKGRNLLSWDEKFNFDVWYVDHVNFLLDLKILFLTVYKVFKRQGIHAPGYSTMPMFYGDQNNIQSEQQSINE